MSWRFLIFPMIMIFQVSNLTAQEQKWTHYGIRPLAMGNAFVAVVDDYNALFYNPAGLARLTEWDGELLNPALSWSDGSVSMLKDFSSLSGSGSDSVQKTLDLIEEQVGKAHHIGLNWTPHLVFKGFGFGMGLEVATNIAFHRYPSVDIDAGPRLIMPISFAFNTLENRLSLGFSVKGLFRAGVNHEFSIQDVEAFTNKDSTSDSKPKLDDFVESGTGYGVDVGMLFTPIDIMQPTLGVSITDFGGSVYQEANLISDVSTGTPKTRLPSLNAGLSIKPIQKQTSYLMTSFDVHSINQPFSFSKKFNVGLEYGWGSFFKFQTGLHQGYLTGGFQIDVRLINIRYATYAEELGVSSGESSLPSRRHMLQLKLII